MSKSDPGAQHRDYGNLYVEVKEKRESVMMLAVSFRMSQSLCVFVMQELYIVRVKASVLSFTG